MDYYLALKKNRVLIIQAAAKWMSMENLPWGQEADTKDHLFYDHICVTCIEQESPRRQKAV